MAAVSIDAIRQASKPMMSNFFESPAFSKADDNSGSVRES